MIRTSRLRVPVIPSFDAVPRQIRKGGWTPERQHGFIAHLAATGSVTAAADAVGLSVTGADHLRAAAGAASFRRAWEAALDAGVSALRTIAYDRAINGTPETRLYHGQPCAVTMRYDNRLLTTILRQYDGPARRAAADIAEAEHQIEPTDVAERMWQYAIRARGLVKWRVAGHKLRLDHLRRITRHLALEPDVLPELLATARQAFCMEAQFRMDQDRMIRGGPEAFREQARTCGGTVQWLPMKPEQLAHARAVRLQLRRAAGEE